MSEHEPEQDGADPELERWQGEWQALGGKDDLAALLVARAAKEGRRLRRAALGEVVGAAFSTAICGWLVVRSHGRLEVVAVAGLILLFNGAWLTHFFTSRSGLFGSPSDGGDGALVTAFAVHSRRRLRAERRWTVFARRWMAALGVLLVPWGIWFFIANRVAYRAQPWRGVVGFGVAAAIFAGVYLWAGVKERRLRGEEEALERLLADALV